MLKLRSPLSVIQIYTLIFSFRDFFRDFFRSFFRDFFRDFAVYVIAFKVLTGLARLLLFPRVSFYLT